MRRHHVQENSIQKALAEAGRRAGLDKRVTPHTLRHCFAPHAEQPFLPFSGGTSRVTFGRRRLMKQV